MFCGSDSGDRPLQPKVHPTTTRMSLELHHDFTFNPDGSGRVTVRWSGPAGPGAPSAEDFARSELERAAGVDAWADVRCEQVDDQLVFEGTAWFPDVGALRFHCQGFHVNLLDLALTAHDDGSVALDSVLATAERTPPPPVAADDLPATLARERDKLEGARGLIEGMFGALRCSAVLRMPAALAEPVRNERVAANAVRVQFDGAQLLTVVDRLLHDDALMTRLLQNGGLDGPAALFELLGDHGPIALRTVPGAATAFDYADEVATARPQFAALTESLRAAVPSDEPGEPLANVRVVAAKVVREADGDRELCPQGQNHAGVTLTIAGDLARAALELEDAGYDRCVLADGRDATPAEAWDRRCHFPKATKDGRTVYLDLELPVPADAGGIEELRGHVTVLASDGETAHDLGFAELTAGAEGTFADARLLAVDQQDEQSWRIEVHVQIARARILGLDLVAGDASTRLEQVGYSCCNDESDLTYRLDGDLPPDARLVMTIVTELSRTRYGFELRSVDWLGAPLPTRG